MTELDILRDIINKLPDHNPGYIHDNILDMDTLKGTAYAIALCNCGKVAVAKTTLSEGCVLDAHYHKEKEIIVLFEGTLRLWINVTSIEDTQDDQFVEYNAGDVVIIEPNIPHVAESITGCKFIILTVPASKGFPKNGR